MKRKSHLVVTQDRKPLVYGNDFKYICQYLDDYCGPNSEFIKFEQTRAKYPDEYWGSFFYEEPIYDMYDHKETIEFRVYEVDFAAPTTEQKRDDDIEGILS